MPCEVAEGGERGLGRGGKGEGEGCEEREEGGGYQVWIWRQGEGGEEWVSQGDKGAELVGEVRCYCAVGCD